jgi:hypothetical protein
VIFVCSVSTDLRCLSRTALGLTNLSSPLVLLVLLGGVLLMAVVLLLLLGTGGVGGGWLDIRRTDWLKLSGLAVRTIGRRGEVEDEEGRH